MHFGVNEGRGDMGSVGDEDIDPGLADVDDDSPLGERQGGGRSRIGLRAGILMGLTMGLAAIGPITGGTGSSSVVGLHH
jgi:hypothetical protein